MLLGRRWFWSAVVAASHCHAVDDLEAAQRKYFHTLVLRAFKGWDGCADAETVLFVLKTSFERKYREGLLVDVGAHTGKTSALMASLYAQPMLSSRHNVEKMTDDLCVDLNAERPPQILAFEPHPENFIELTSRMHDLRASLGLQFNFTAVEAAVADRNGYGTFFHAGVGDQAGFIGNTSSMAYRPSEDAIITASRTVRFLTLDSFIGPKHIFLLKIDAEGADPLVLMGAIELLRRRHVKFLIFEVSTSWARHRKGKFWLALPRMVKRLSRRGYVCFYITRAALVPISGSWWHKDYAHATWTNVFCGQLLDADLFDAYIAYGSNKLTLHYALKYLNAGGGERRICLDWPVCNPVI